MTDHSHFIDALSHNLAPVRRPLGSTLKSLLWMAIAVAVGSLMGLLLYRHDTDWSRPGAIWALLNLALALTAGLVASISSFQHLIPGQKPWPWQALAGLLVAWLLVNLMSTVGARQPLGELGDGSYCYTFVVITGAPMVALILASLRRSPALRPGPTLIYAGLSTACWSLSLLALCHPVHTSLVDLLMHVAGAATLVLLTWLPGRRLISAFRPRSGRQLNRGA